MCNTEAATDLHMYPGQRYVECQHNEMDRVGLTNYNEISTNVVL